MKDRTSPLTYRVAKIAKAAASYNLFAITSTSISRHLCRLSLVYENIFEGNQGRAFYANAG